MKNEFDWERFKKGEIIVHCETEEKAINFMKACDKQGLRWVSSEKPLEFKGFYNDVAKKACKCYEGELAYGSIDSYRGNYEIIEWSIQEKTTKNTEENKIKEVLEVNKECIEFSWEDFKKEKMYVHCDTEEKAKDFVRKAFENNCGWHASDISETYFTVNKEETCYRLIDNRLSLVELSYRLHKKYPVIKWEIKQDSSESDKGENASMKYSVGDKVKIREDLQKGKMYSFHYNIINEMLELKGKTAIITKYIPNEYYELDIDNGEYCWTDEMLEDTDSTETIRSFTELMVNHEENQIWESLDDLENIKRVIFKDWGVNFILNKDLYELKDYDINEFGINNNCKFRLITHKDTIKANFQQYIDEEYPIIDLQLKDGNSIGFKTEKQKYKFEDDYILITAEGYEMKIKYDAIECVAI